ncbi:hypothetical protein V1L52_10325 [Treponema sp. HNW]|uniref:hypothetical protein n=1 Tax=Treponema sp. HNW TaxID=3116654 RepID=UPI003D12CB13
MKKRLRPPSNPCRTRMYENVLCEEFCKAKLKVYTAHEVQCTHNPSRTKMYAFITAMNRGYSLIKNEFVADILTA